MAAAPTNWPPLTAREVLAAFFPLHAWHTVVLRSETAHTVMLHCDCGSSGLRIYDDDAKKKGWTMAAVKSAVKLVPTKPSTSPRSSPA